MRSVLALALTTLCGCGLISSDVTDIGIQLPDKKFSIDTDGYQIDRQQADAALAFSCASSPSVCGELATKVCTMGCSGSCAPAPTQTCEFTLDVSVVQPVNLLAEQPDLKTFSDQSVVKVGIDSVTYEIPSNTLNVATPVIAVYVAPMAAVKLDPLNKQIKQIGTIAPVAAGKTTTAPVAIQFTATGKQELQDIMGSFKTPFNILVGSQIVVDKDSDIPTGRLDAVVHVKGHVGL
ncbi:MAG TPA: hypothetical protein VFP84_22130 [Kofleriaceae bacterium]|nr:hypothetical protein [Kofleriaceae bacterium]